MHIGAISAIYSRETGAGMGFEVQPYDPSNLTEADSSASVAWPAEPKTVADTPAPAPVLEVTDGGRADDAQDEADDEATGDAKRPRLTIVK